jgi:hypothetical protein
MGDFRVQCVDLPIIPFSSKDRLPHPARWSLSYSNPCLLTSGLGEGICFVTAPYSYFHCPPFIMPAEMPGTSSSQGFLHSPGKSWLVSCWLAF